MQVTFSADLAATSNVKARIHVAVVRGMKGGSNEKQWVQVCVCGWGGA